MTDIVIHLHDVADEDVKALTTWLDEILPTHDAIREYNVDTDDLSDVTDEMVDDLLVAAFEGGINYWADKIEVVGGMFPEGAEYASECLTRGRDLRIRDAVSEESEWHTLTLANFQAGIRKEAARLGLTVERFHEEHDAGTADNAVQWALFNELVYG